MMHNRLAACLIAIVVVAPLAAWLAAAPRAEDKDGQSTTAASGNQREAGLAAWQQIYAMLTHPRCLNCHTATHYPQQGDDRHRHFANVVRGPEGRGVPGLHCATCHQDANAESTGVPGSHNWHLAPLSMAWQDLHDRPLSSAEVCSIITDRAKNHDMDGAALLQHNAEDKLVGWAWEPGRGINGAQRTLPPLARVEFAAATRRWVEAGTPCP